MYRSLGYTFFCQGRFVRRTYEIAAEMENDPSFLLEADYVAFPNAPRLNEVHGRWLQHEENSRMAEALFSPRPHAEEMYAALDGGT